jgi:hypothetical protein
MEEGRGDPDGVWDDGSAAWIAAARSPSNDEAEELARCSNPAQGKSQFTFLFQPWITNNFLKNDYCEKRERPRQKGGDSGNDGGCGGCACFWGQGCLLVEMRANGRRKPEGRCSIYGV